MKKLKKILTLLSVLALIAVQFSDNSLNEKAQSAELNQLIADAYISGEVEVTPIANSSENYWQANNSYTLASLLGNQTKQPFKGGDEYVLERLDTGEILKLEINPDSNLLNNLDSKPVIVEENISFEANSLDGLSTVRRFNSTPPNYEGVIQENSEVVIALVDSGFSHVNDYQSRLAQNLLEQEGEAGVDDDGNGYIDDLVGWNFIDNNNQVGDLNGHGTHLAGIAMALSNAKILPIQTLDAQNMVTLDRLLAALDYAAVSKADIINLSIGSKSDSTILKKLLSKLESEGTIIVASAGNYSENVVLNPAAYHSVVAVGALNHLGKKAYYSNFGSQVDLSYKGQMLSFGPNQDALIIKQGTSQAAAAVSAILATVKSQMPELEVAELINYVKKSGQLIQLEQLGHKINLDSLAKSLLESKQN